MPIKKGSTTIDAIYKGTTQIAKVYKGTTLLFENAVWLDYYFSNLYHSLVPETISSKSVKNKAKVAKIYANGVVENQLIPSDKIPASGTSSDIVLTNNGDGSYTLNGTASAIATFVCYSVGTLYKGHKYLMNLVPKGGSASTYLGGDANGALDPTDYGGTIVSTTFNTETYGFVYYIRVFSGTSVNFTHKPQLIDLTLMFGTGNEPTSLSDHRIQAILNRGYIPYNAGTYKGTDIGEFESEPYNLFDGELEGNGIDTTTGADISSGNNFRSKNYTSVVGGCQYTIELNGTALGTTGYNFYLMEYDENKNFLQTTEGWQMTSKTYTMLNNTKYVRFQVWKSNSNWATNVPTDTNIVIHRTGTRTGYAPYQTFTPISFRYQGNGAINAHDTMEITKDNVVFTKNVASYTFTGSESWTTWTNGRYYTGVIASSVKIPTSTGVISNAAFGSYLSIKQYDLVNYDKTFAIGESNGNLIIRDTTISNVATSLTGWTVYYELATPQTITIPRKYMGVVDLGSLTWVMISSGRFYVENFNPPSTVRNCYCSKYLTDLSTNGISEQANNTVQMRGDLKIIDTTYTSASDFKAAMTGTYLFYETSAETTDIADTLDIEAGGTVTSNWFSWVENQLQPDNIRYINGGTGVNTAPFETTATYNFADRNPNYTSVAFGNGNGFDIIQGHKYLMAIYIKPASDTIRFSCGVTESATTYTSCSPNVWTKIASITTSSSTVASYGFVFRYNEAASVTNQVVYFKNWMTVDLTQAFGAGNEPTSINDPRIQYILNKGYIPTNTTGILKHIDTEVLPNVDMKIKCK